MNEHEFYATLMDDLKSENLVVDELTYEVYFNPANYPKDKIVDGTVSPIPKEIEQ